MSLIPTDSDNINNSSISDSLTTFPQHLWDTFFPSSPFPFPSSPFTAPTVPSSALTFEASGNLRGKLECKDVEEAHLVVADLPGVDKAGLDVAPEEGGFVRISGPDEGFLWRVRLPADACVGMMSWSFQNGVLTVVVPKAGSLGPSTSPFLMGGWGWGNTGARTNVRRIEIEGSD